MIYQSSVTYVTKCAHNFIITLFGKALSATKFKETTKMIPGKPKVYHKWKVGCINIQSCSDDLRLDLALQDCVRANLDIICFQEVRRLKTDSVSHLGYTFHWSGHKRKKIHGVGIAIRNTPDIVIEGIQHHGARLMAVDIDVKGCKLRILSCYAPTLSTPLSTKQAFYRSLNSVSKPDAPRKLLVQGDFNAELDICRGQFCFDGSKSRIDEGSNQLNENAMLFVQYCQKQQLSILNTWFKHPIHHRVTWHNPNGIGKKVYDYSLSRSWIRQFICDVRVRNSYFSSDHRLVVTKLQTPANRAARKSKPKKKLSKRPNFQLLENTTVFENVKDEISDYLVNNTTSSRSVDTMHTKIIKAMENGRKVIPSQIKSQQNIPWNYDDEFTGLISERKQIRSLEMSVRNKAKIKELTKSIKTKVRTIRNNILKAKAEEINTAKGTRQVAKLWKKAKNHDKIILNKPKPIQCPGLDSHFKQHFSPDHTALSIPSELQDPPQYIQLLQNFNTEIGNHPPSLQEICNAIKKLNKGKATIDVETEVLVCATSIPDFTNLLEDYFKNIWTYKEIPDQWRLSRITALWKNKGNAFDPTKYRGISIGSILCKVGMNIALKRLDEFYETQVKANQYGFRRGVGCNDAIYVVKQLQEIASVSQKELFICFIDLSSAFDHINRDMLFKSIRNRLPLNSLTTTIDIVENLYKFTKSFLQGDNPDDAFRTEAGVRQGGVEGPPLYNLYSDYTLRVYNDKRDDAGVSGLRISYEIPQAATNREQRSSAPSSGITDEDEVGYADDLGIFSWSLEELQISINILVNVFSEFGLEVNLTKTETMIVNWNQVSESTYPESIISVNGVNIKNVESFKYLGVYIQYDSIHIGKDELSNRVNSAHNAFAEHRKLLTNMHIPLSTRISFLNSLVRSRLTYGCHCWRPSSTEINKVESTYRYFLRSMVWSGHARVNPPAPQTSSSQSSSSETSSDDEETDWRYKINNNELSRITNTGPISDYIKKQQRQWISHIVRRSNSNLCKKLTFHNVTRTKRGRKTPTILERVISSSGLQASQFLKSSFHKVNGR